MHRVVPVIFAILFVLPDPMLWTPSMVARRVNPTAPLATIDRLEQHAWQSTNRPARVSLAAITLQNEPHLRLGGPDAPNYARAIGSVLPQVAQPLAVLVHAVLYRGELSTETKAAMGLRVAQVNDSPYVAAHTLRLLRASRRGSTWLAAMQSPSLPGLEEADVLAIRYAEALTRRVHGVSDDQFSDTRRAYNDGEIVELTLAVCFFNYLTRYANALRLPVESWALDRSSPALAPHTPTRPLARVALISDDEIDAASAALASARGPGARVSGLGLGMANSQRAMLQAPALALAWRAYGAAVRETREIGRDIDLQVSLAVSTTNECRYCTLHQVLGLRRLGVDPARLMAMRKSDDVLTAREKVAVRFARKLTASPGDITDADYAALTQEFGERGAVEVLLQTCAFAFMNRFTDGLRLPSEDEAVCVYRETYGTDGH